MHVALPKGVAESGVRSRLVSAVQRPVGSPPLALSVRSLGGGVRARAMDRPASAGVEGHVVAGNGLAALHADLPCVDRAPRRVVSVCAEQLGKDIEEGREMGVSGTPSFVLGITDPENPDKVHVTRFVRGARNYDAFAKEIDELLAGDGEVKAEASP